MEEKQTQENQVEMAGIPVKTRIRVGHSFYTSEECKVICQGEENKGYCEFWCEYEPHMEE